MPNPTPQTDRFFAKTGYYTPKAIAKEMGIREHQVVGLARRVEKRGEACMVSVGRWRYVDKAKVQEEQKRKKETPPAPTTRGVGRFRTGEAFWTTMRSILREELEAIFSRHCIAMEPVQDDTDTRDRSNGRG